MNNTRKFDGDRIAAVAAIKETLHDCCGICMEPTLNQYTDYKMEVSWHPQEHRRKDGTTYYHLAQKADDLFKPAYQAYGMCDITTLIRAVDDIYAKYNELEAKYQEQCKIISEYEEDKQKTDKLMLEFQERYFDAEKQLKEVKADNEDLECQLNENYLAKKLADEQQMRADAEVTASKLREEHQRLKNENVRAVTRYTIEYQSHIETLQKLKSLRDLLETEGIHTFPKGHTVACDDTLKATNAEWTVAFTYDKCNTVAQLECAIEAIEQERNDIIEKYEELKRHNNEKYEAQKRKNSELLELLETEGIRVVEKNRMLLGTDYTVINEKYEEQKRRNGKLAQKNTALGQHIAELCDQVHEMKKHREEYIFEPVTKDKINCAFCKFEDALGIDIGPMDADVVWRANRILKGIYDLKDKSSYVQFDCPFHTNPEDGI